MALYTAHSTTMNDYSSETQYRNTGIFFFGTAGGTLIDNFENAANYTASSLTKADSTDYHKTGTKSMALTAFNAASDYAMRDFTSVDWSSFTGFKFWLRADHEDGFLTILMIDTNGYGAHTEVRSKAANTWELKHFSKSGMILSNASFDWTAVRYIRFYTSGYTNTTAYYLDSLCGTGSSALKIWTDQSGTLNGDELIIGMPEVAYSGIAAADGGAGAVFGSGGTWNYRFAYVNDETDPPQVGALSAALSHTTSGAVASIGLSNIPDPNDPDNVQRIRIYRTQDGDTTYYELDEIEEGTTTYTDTTSDATIGGHDSLSTRDVQNAAEWPECKYCKVCANRLFGMGDQDNKKILYWSELGKPLEFRSDNYNELDIKGEDWGTGLIELNNVLYVTTNKSIWRVANLDQAARDWEYEDLELGVGCVGHRTIRKLGTGVGDVPVACFLSDYPLNAYAFDGATVMPIGDAIVPAIEDTEPVLRQHCPSAIDGEKQRYILGLSSSGNTDNWDVAYAYDLRASRKRGKPVWRPFDWGSFTALGSSVVGGEGYLYDGSEYGFVYVRDVSKYSDSITNATSDITVNAVSSGWYSFLNVSPALPTSGSGVKGLRAYVSSGTGAGSWGTILDQTKISSTEWLYIPTWVGTGPMAASVVRIGPIGWYYNTKIFDLEYVSQFVWLHIYFAPDCSPNELIVRWYLNRSTTETSHQTVTVSNNYARVGLPCLGRQIQFKFEDYYVNTSDGDRTKIVGYHLTHIPRSET